MNIQEFKQRYLIIDLYNLYNPTSSDGKILKKHLNHEFYKYLFKKAKYYSYKGTNFIIIDLIEEKLMATFDGKLDSSVTITKDGYNYIEDSFSMFKRSDTKMIYNQNILGINFLKTVISTYSVDDVWLFIKYNTSNNNVRYLVNKNIFGDAKVFLSRQYKIKKLLAI